MRQSQAARHLEKLSQSCKPMGFEESLIRNAAPTLAGIKVANLYNYSFKSSKECRESIGRLNRRMNSKGIYIELFKNVDDFYLIYVYRKSLLTKELARADVQDFLTGYGYENSMNITECVERLKARINSQECFPHEIGVFLGYPLPDVKSFIEKKGQDCIACGEWKVYHNEQEAMCLFCKLRHCKEIYIKVYGAGRSIYDMTVSA